MPRSWSSSKVRALTLPLTHPVAARPLTRRLSSCAELRLLQTKHLEMQEDAATRVQRVQRARVAHERRVQHVAAATLQRVQRARVARELGWLAGFAAQWHSAVVVQRHARGSLWRRRVLLARLAAEREIADAAALIQGVHRSRRADRVLRAPPYPLRPKRMAALEQWAALPARAAVHPDIIAGELITGGEQDDSTSPHVSAAREASSVWTAASAEYRQLRE